MKWKKVTPCGPGLFNHGNTCFLNSTLQCLFYIPAFNQILMEERAKPTGTTLSLGSSKDGQQSMLRLFARFDLRGTLLLNKTDVVRDVCEVM